MVNDVAFFILMLRRESLLRWRKRHEIALPILFFFLAIILFPMVTTVNPQRLPQIGGGVIWLVALLALLMTLPKLFEQDASDGSLELLMSSSCPLVLAILAKAIVHCLWFVIPLLCLLPLVAIIYNLAFASVAMLALTLLIVLPLMSLLGVLVAALMVGLPRSEALMALLFIPLALPGLLLSHIALTHYQWHQSVLAPILILVAMLLLAVTFLPILSVLALRLGLQAESG